MMLPPAGGSSPRRRLPAAAWLAALLPLLLLRDGVEGRRRPPRGHRGARDGPSPHDGRRRRVRTDARDDDDDPGVSYFERHGLPVPPLPRRRALTSEAATEAAASDADSAAAALHEKSSTFVAFGDAPTELERIVANARSGRSAEVRLRSDLLGGYDKHAFPWEYVWYNQTQRTGLPVEIGINFHRINHVDIVDSVMDMNVWFRLQWADPRLTWRPEDYGDLNETKLWIGDGGAGGETSEIWTPDVELWNQDDGLGSLDDAYAVVSHDGTVFWSRPGHLKPACKFTGLSVFPFDRLECTMEFGSWANSGKYLRMEKFKGTGYSLGGSETAGESYNEFSFAKEEPVRCEAHVYGPYPGSPEDDWPVLMYHLAFDRSWQPYARGYVLQQTLFNIIGFSAFWLPPSSGERMGLSITAMLAAVASEIIIAENLPLAREVTWFWRFSMMSMLFAFVSLLECVIVLHLYDKRDAGLVRKWYKFAKRKLLGQKNGAEAETQTNDGTAGGDGVVAGTAVDAMSNMANTQVTSMRKSAAARSRHLGGDVFNDNAKTETASPGSDASSNASSSGNHDPRSTGERACGRRTTFAKSRTDGSQFIARDADDFRDSKEAENAAKWKKLSEKIDDHARFWIPLAFFIALSVLLAEVF